ncbi:3-hydroxyacyl-CoA dehydrogenase family protein [Streptomyces sp. NPDC127110]|uniref:3-hydroxyacyl-CoA dehydrogenase family protein n=1 Tax=Streptomyces sp. NPDC127110 TaxID=3345362 RepID=UPI003641ECA4
MGSGITEVCARAGRDVVVVETSSTAAAAGLERVVRSLGRATVSGRLTAAERDAAAARLTVTTDLARLADRDLVVEAVTASGVLGKEVVRARDRAGFVVNALLGPYLPAAVRMAEGGRASAEEIDRGMTLGCAHPVGPLALADLTGLDTVQAIARSMYAEHREPQYSPPPLLARGRARPVHGRRHGEQPT